MAGYIYPDAYLVWHTLKVVAASMSLQQALTLRFDFTEHPQEILTLDEHHLITALRVDQLLVLSDVQMILDKYFNELKQQDEWNNQLKACGARRKTLEMRARNLDNELSKSGLFRSRKQEPLKQERDRISTQLTQIHGEMTTLTTKLESLEQQRRTLGERISTDDSLRSAQWVATPNGINSGVAVFLTNEGQFLLDYLSEMKPEVLKGRTLPEVLVYGMAWSLAEKG